jgi:hypothetical protein
MNPTDPQSLAALKTLVAEELFLTDILEVRRFVVPEELRDAPVGRTEEMAERCATVARAVAEAFGERLREERAGELFERFTAAEAVLRRVARAGRLLNLSHVPLEDFVAAFGWPREDAPVARRLSPSAPPQMSVDPDDLAGVLEAAPLLARHGLASALNLLTEAASRHPRDPAPLQAALRLAREYGTDLQAARQAALLRDRFPHVSAAAPSGLANPTAPPSAAPVLAAAPVMTGELGAVTFFDVLQVCQTARFTAVLSIAAQTVAGRVRFTDGAIVGAQAEDPDARSSPTNGRDALKLLTRRLDGARATFSVRLGESELPHDIVASSNAALLMDLAAELDEENRDLLHS